MRLGFNPRDYATRRKKNGKDSKYKPAPEGFYNVECIEVSITVSDKGNKMIKAVFEILDPPAANTSHVREYFLLEHPDSDNVRRARENLAEWAIAADKPDFQDTDELAHTQCRVKLVVDPGGGDYDPSNKIKFYVKPRGTPKSVKAEAKPEPQAEPKDELADDIPF